MGGPLHFPTRLPSARYGGNSPVDFRSPTLLDFPAFTVFATNYPAYKLFILVISIAIFVGLFVMPTHTRIGLWAGLGCGLEILVR
jgi:branched-subunit amino acid ABC-type transport system permease component